ncbi:MAG: response regulator transcription factor [Oscillospiraceae bacterium]|nr:response regulator transcription factor [Oscillospiraceae bacterium]
MNETILLVEDDRDLSDVVAAYLQNEGLTVAQAFTGPEALEMSRQAPQVVLLDIMLPGVDGIELCRRIRETSRAPIIMISAKNTDMDKLLSLGMGADDYMTKPFSLPELAGRIRAHLRRHNVYAKGSDSGSVTKRLISAAAGTDGGGGVGGDGGGGGGGGGALLIDALAYSVTMGDTPVPLTAKEFHLLDFLSAHPGQVFTKSQLMDEIWGYHEYVDENTIAVYIARLREKLTRAHAFHIKTVWGVGYKWDE